MQWKLIHDLQKVSHKMGILSVLVLIMSVCIPVTAQAQQTISGTVISAKDGETLIGVNVMEKGTTTGVMTDVNGRFSLSANVPCELVFSYVGFLDRTITVTSFAPLTISLEEDAELLDEVVVVGYGVQKKKLVTGSTVQVKGEDITRQNTVNPLGALQSQTPGVDITQASGMPGEGFKVVIRGLGTVGSAGPLYIIDGSAGGDINSLNPSDIESIDVLKDAASAAIYGSRAANGVVLVTTRQGRAGKPEITFDAYYGIQNVYKMPDILNAQEYVAIMNETRLNDGLPVYNYAAEVPNWADYENGKNKGTNWLDASRNKNAPIQNYALNVTGGTQQSKYSIGLSYTSQEGILGKPVQPRYQRYTARVNSEHTIIRSGDLDILKFGENITYSYSTNTGISIGDMWSNDVRNLIKAHPLRPVYNESGEYNDDRIPYEIKMANPISLMEKNASNINKNHRLKANVFLTLQPIKDLVFKSNLGYVMNAGTWRSYMPEYDLSLVSINGTESVSQSMWTGHSLTWENTISYQHSFGKHNLSALLGQSIEKSGMGESLDATNGNPKFHDLEHAYIDNAPLTSLNEATSMGGSPWTRSALASFFGRINYDYDNKYMLTVVVRADGSSVFARGHRWGVFPSVSAGWVLTEEPWMKPAEDVLSFMKIRASWGQNGNQDIAPFQYLSTISNDASYIFGGGKDSPVLGSYPDILPNKDLTWETSEQVDIGLDMRFFQSRLGLTFDWYIKNTKDWLVAAPQLASFGTGAPYINGGDVRNEGVELALDWNDEVGDFKYGAHVNMSYNKNEITRLANSEGVIHGPVDIPFQAADECYRAEVGFPIGYFYGYSTAGVFQSQEEVDNYKGAKLPDAREGDLIWVDRNQDGSIDEKDRGFIGDPHPDFRVGLGVNLSWKGLDFALTMNGAFGQQIMKSYRSWSDSPKENHTSDIFGRWHGYGTSNRLPRLSSNSHPNWTWVSDIYVENGDYMRIQNITLGYDFKSLIKSKAIGQLRLYISAQNLYTFTKYSGMDPEVGYGGYDDWSSGIDLGFYPSPRTYMVGVNIKF